MTTTTSQRARLDAYLRARAGATARREPSIPVRADQGPAPLSFGQEGIWRRARALPGVPLYNETITIHRRGPLQVAALQRSLDDLLRRHEAWRTTFHGTGDGAAVQRVEPAVPVPISVHDLRSLPAAARLPEAFRLAAADARAPFDLSQGPLFRARLVRLHDEEYRLFMAVHQILLDGVSVYRVLVPELIAGHDAYAGGRTPHLPELPIQFSDFAAWQRSALEGKTLDRQVAYWESRFADLPPPLRWPARARPPRQTYGGAIIPFALSPELGRGLRALAAREGVTLFVTALAAFARLLHRYTAQDDLVIGTPSPAGRKRSEVQGLLGYFLNPVALRLDLSEGPSFQELLAQARVVVGEAVSHDDLPFERIVERLRADGDPGRHPLFTVAVSQEPPMPDVGPGWDLTPMDVTSGGARWDLYLVLDDRRGRGILGRVQYNPDLFEAAMMEAMVRDFRCVLEDAVRRPDRPVTEAWGA